MGKKYRIGNVCLFIGNKDYFYRFTRMFFKNVWKEPECGSHVEEIDEKRIS